MSSKRQTRKDPNRYPAGWNSERTRALIEHYDRQTEDEAITEADAAHRDPRFTMMGVPVELVNDVRRMIAKHTKSKAAKGRGKNKGRRAA